MKFINFQNPMSKAPEDQGHTARDQRQQKQHTLTRPPSIHYAAPVPMKSKQPVRRKEPKASNRDTDHRCHERKIETTEDDPAHFLELLNERNPERASSSMLRFRW